MAASCLSLQDTLNGLDGTDSAQDASENGGRQCHFDFGLLQSRRIRELSNRTAKHETGVNVNQGVAQRGTVCETHPRQYVATTIV